MSRRQSEAAKFRVLKALEKPQSRYKFRELARIAGSRVLANEAIAQLRREGRQIVYGKVDHRFYLAKIPTPYSNYFDMSWLPESGKIGLVSDTHLCSEAERLDILNDAYDEFVKQGITTVVHCGDLSDGWQVYRGHEQHVKCIGVQEQAAYVVKNYPMREGIKTYFISGNHDNKAFEKQGIDVCSLVVNGFDHRGKHIDGRTDMVYLGQYSRILLLPQNVTVDIIHPMGSGVVYARSYPAQRRSREMLSETRPDIQLSGHYHNFIWFLEDRTHFVGLAAFQDETEFFRRMGYGRQMGFCVMEYEISENRVSSLKVEFFRRA